MTTPAPAVPLIYAALALCMKEIGADGGIRKDRENKQQNFKFRGIDQVYNALNSIFARNGVVPVPCYSDRVVDVRKTKDGTGTLYNVTVRGAIAFYAQDGSSVVATTYGEAMDSADKATNKAESAAYKYACFQVLCIPTEETAQDSDGDPKVETSPPITAEQLADLRKQMAELKINEQLFCQSTKIARLEDILFTDLPGVQKLLEKKRKKLATAPANDASATGSGTGS